MKSILILDNIRSAENVGSLFRTADAVGIEHIYLVGITPSPIDRFGRPCSKIAKTALGAEQRIAWSAHSNATTLVQALQKEGWYCVAIEQSPQSVDYKTIGEHDAIACIVGNEVAGITPDVLDVVDAIAEIPMAGTKESLNVAVAGGVALFRILNK